MKMRHASPRADWLVFWLAVVALAIHAGIAS